MSGIGILILAAGASSRLGQPKQLLPYRGKPLIRQMAEGAIAAGGRPVGVVLGAYADIIALHLVDLDLHLTVNQGWKTGMASSVQQGLRDLLALSPDLEALILLVCDQPFVTPQLIQQLISTYETGRSPIVASAYAGTFGVPALFHRTLFSEFDALQGDVGARFIIQRYRPYVLSIPFAAGILDLDTPEHLRILSICL